MTSPAKILVVDDERGIRDSVGQLLERDGYQVTAVDSGAAALRVIAEQEFDVALIDLKMPGVDGMQVLAELRRRWPTTPVVVLTAYATLETAMQALRQDAHDYLAKPCRAIDLRESVRSALARRQRELYIHQLLARDVIGDAASGDAARGGPEQSLADADNTAPDSYLLQYQGVMVDAQRHVITVHGQQLELSLTEFALLAYLVSHAPRVVSAEELAREVLKYHSEGPDARENIYTYVHQIRRKARDATRHEVIRTVRGVGYTVSA